jgi:hypothetical protein
VKVCAPVQAFEPLLTAALASRRPRLLPAQRLGPFAHVFTELRVLDAIPENGSHFVRNLPDVLARCVANAA